MIPLHIGKQLNDSNLVRNKRYGKQCRGCHQPVMIKIQPVHWLLLKGTKRTGIILLVRVLPPFFSTSISCCTMKGEPTGMIIRPPSFNCSIKGGGICSAAAVTTIASNGDLSFQP